MMNNIERYKCLKEANEKLIENISERIIKRYSVTTKDHNYVWVHIEEFTEEVIRRILGSKKFEQYLNEFKKIDNDQHITRCGYVNDWGDHWRREEFNLNKELYFCIDLAYKINIKFINKRVQDYIDNNNELPHLSTKSYYSDIESYRYFGSRRAKCYFDDYPEDILVSNFNFKGFERESRWVGMDQVDSVISILVYCGFLIHLIYSHPDSLTWHKRLKEENYLYFLINSQSDNTLNKGDIF